MNKEIQGIIAVILSIAGGIALVVAVCLGISHLNDKAFIAGGYTHEILVGANSVQWVKK